MNTQLRRMIVNAEGRYLNEPELTQLRDYALGMSSRLETARHIEAAEERVAQRALDALVAQQPDLARKNPARLQQIGRDLRLTLRHAASAHVRLDPESFRKSHAAWAAPLMLALGDAPLTIAAYEQLAAAVESQLDPIDARAVAPFIDLFLAELRR